jgi:hypothetical protein
LQAGDEAVKAALDQLIEAHHEGAAHVSHGQVQAGDSDDSGLMGSRPWNQDVVLLGAPTIGAAASEPVLILRPDIATIRLKPNDVRRFLIYPRPENAWKTLESLALTLDPPIKELQVARIAQLSGEEVALKFVEPEDIDEDEYPIETVLRSMATFKGHTEPRVLERRVIVNPSKDKTPRPQPPLRDEPTYIKVTSRLPIKIVLGGPDVHVKLRWDGKDELVAGAHPKWTFRVSCESVSVEPPTFLTRPVDGRFELLIQAVAGLHAGEQLKFDVEAVGPGKTLTTAFLADVVELPTPRKISGKLPVGAQRRPPYELKYVKRENWKDETCWGEAWTGDDAGSFEPPSQKSALTIFINQDMDLLTNYRETLLAKKIVETTIQQRINKYTTHVAFHLYQMYLKKKDVESAKAGSPLEALTEEQMHDEIQRVSRTLVKLMEVSQ